MISALVALGVYAVTLGGTLVYDDIALIRVDPRIADPRLWGRYFTESYNGGVDNLYRPVVSMSYALQHFIHGATAWPYHLVNVVLHAIVTALVAAIAVALVRRVADDDAGANRVGLIAGLLFAVHPVHVEAVANIVGRAEMLCAIGSLGALLICLQGHLTARRVVGAWALFATSVFSKEQAMLMPLVTLVIFFVVRRRVDATQATVTAEVPSTDSLIEYRHPKTRPTRDPHASALFALVAVTLATFVVLREQVLGLKFWWDRVFLDRWIQPLADSAGVDRLLAPLLIVGRYFILLVVPYRLHIDYGGVITPGVVRAGDPLLWLGLSAIALWIVWMILSLRRGDRLSIALLLAFAILYGALGNIVTLIGVNVADRLMYMPSTFFVILVALPLARWVRRWPTAWVLVAMVLVLAGLRTVSYAARWNDRATFYAYMLEQDPRSARAALLCAQEATEQGRLHDAVAFAKRAVAIQPSYGMAQIWLARTYMAVGDLDAAEAILVWQDKINPQGEARFRLEDLYALRRATTQPATK